ncbi:MAG: metallophosphoesterase [Verrucomicrobiota bacterium]
MPCGFVALLFLLCLAWVPLHGATVTLGVIGDYGSGDTNEANVARLVKSWNPDLIITVGDNNYDYGAAETIDENVGQFYHEYIAPYHGRYGAGALTNRFFPTLGNHDWWVPMAKPYLDYFTLPGNGRYYGIRHGPVELFAVDSDAFEPDGNSPLSRQAAWLKRRLSLAKAPWRIVYFHESPYSSGNWHGSHWHECDQMRWPFAEWGASVVLSGHDHTYERVHTNNLVYFINGLGGGRKDTFFTEPVPGSAMRYSAEHGAMRIDATETNLVLRFINWQGQTQDRYELKKP